MKALHKTLKKKEAKKVGSSIHLRFESSEQQSQPQEVLMDKVIEYHTYGFKTEDIRVVMRGLLGEKNLEDIKKVFIRQGLMATKVHQMPR